MEFSLFTAEGGDSPEMFRGNAAYNFNNSGLLTIVNEGKRRSTRRALGTASRRQSPRGNAQ